MRTEEVASVLELKRELWEIVVALELARSDSLDFLGCFEEARDSAKECRGSLGGGSSGNGLSTGLNKPFGDDLKIFTGITAGCDLDELERLGLDGLSAESEKASGGTGALGRRGGGVTVRVDSSSPDSYASEPSWDGCKADGGGDGRMVFGSTGTFNRLWRDSENADESDVSSQNEATRLDATYQLLPHMKNQLQSSKHA